MLNIVHYPHPALRFPAKPLNAIDKHVRLVAGRMLELMYAAHGLGLAANQVAWPYQLFILNPTANPQLTDHQHVLINPVITERKGTIEGDEGCLSFPDLYQKVRRARSVKVSAYDLDGKPVEFVTTDLPSPLAELTSRVLQHEIDHLHGVLFIDKMGPLGKMAARGTLREFERAFRKLQDKGQLPDNDQLEKQLRHLADSPAATAEIL